MLCLHTGLECNLECTLECINNNPNASYTELAEKLGIKRRTLANRIKQLTELGLIRREGYDKTGYWVVSYNISPKDSSL
ncbi:winged helix-turn-helix transcriptional regulator [Muribaculaceae bacterium Isolate-037 (Harlan)]|nr:winged helix-turn-helix transcriptional regulator [Muribaculaceae bacterium Isolate-037 (Harlan)]